MGNDPQKKPSKELVVRNKPEIVLATDAIIRQLNSKTPNLKIVNQHITTLEQEEDANGKPMGIKAYTSGILEAMKLNKDNLAAQFLTARLERLYAGEITEDKLQKQDREARDKEKARLSNPWADRFWAKVVETDAAGNKRPPAEPLR